MMNEPKITCFGGERDGLEMGIPTTQDWVGGQCPDHVWVPSALGQAELSLKHPSGNYPPERLAELSICAYRFARCDVDDDDEIMGYVYKRDATADLPAVDLDLPEEYLHPRSSS